MGGGCGKLVVCAENTPRTKEHGDAVDAPSTAAVVQRLEERG